MSQVLLDVDGHSYSVNCADGQESHLHDLNTLIVKKMAFVRANLRPRSDDHALYLTCILLANEVADMSKRESSCDSDKNAVIEDNKNLRAGLEEAGKKLDALVSRTEEIASLLTQSRTAMSSKIKQFEESENSSQLLL